MAEINESKVSVSDNDERKKKKKIIAMIIAILLVICAVIAFFIYNNVLSAVTMRIQRLVGTVTLFNESGSEQSLREKMRLGAGQTVTTGGESLIMVSLDDTKLITMEETSRADIKARGKKLQFKLIEGNLFFNVTEKLKDNEEFDVHTSTMICGIRGTSAYVGRDSTSHEILMVTDGLVHVIATNPITKESLEVDVPAGQMITIYLDEEAEGNKTISIKMSSFKEEDLPALALDTMRKNKALMDRVAKATGFSTKKLSTLADLSCKKGVSMFGSAADELKAEGVDDAIPYMGDRSHEMVSSANSALNIARDDLPLEVAIIQGYRDVLDVGVEAGYDTDNLGTLMRGTRDCMERTFKGVERAGLRSLDRINVATRISNTLRVSAGRMAASNLSTREIEEVLDAEAQLFEGTVAESAAGSTDGSRGADVLASLDRIGDHVTGTVDDEMDKQSNGEETVIALLGTAGSGSGRSSDDVEDVTPANTNKATANAGDTNIEGTPATGDGGAAAGSTRNTSSGGATSAELNSARASIVATDPNTGMVVLADGTLFDPAYYAAANPDVVARYGTDTAALLAEWLNEGKAQGRPPVAPTTPTPAQPQNDNNDSSGGDDPYSDNSDEEDNNNNNNNNNSGGSSGGNNGGGGGGSTGSVDLSTLIGVNPPGVGSGQWTNNGSTFLVTSGDANGFARIPASINGGSVNKVGPSEVAIDSNASPPITNVAFNGSGTADELVDFLDNNAGVQTATADVTTLNRVGSNNYSASVSTGSSVTRGTVAELVNNMKGSGASSETNVQSVTVNGTANPLTVTTSGNTTTATVNGTVYSGIHLEQDMSTSPYDYDVKDSNDTVIGHVGRDGFYL